MSFVRDKEITLSMHGVVSILFCCPDHQHWYPVLLKPQKIIPNRRWSIDFTFSYFGPVSFDHYVVNSNVLTGYDKYFGNIYHNYMINVQRVVTF